MIRALVSGPFASRFRRNRGAMLGLAIITILVLFALFGPWLTRHAPNHSDFIAGADAFGAPVGPTAEHWLGTDAIFRDELSRLAHGARLSLIIAVVATVIATTLGTLVGLVSGWVAERRGAVVDVVLMRLVDVLLSFPYLLLVMAIGAALDETSTFTVLWVLGLTSWLGTARLVRAKTIAIRQLGYIEAARALGQRAPALLLRHVLPNIAGTIIVVATLSMSSMILAESVLSYLQVGVPPPTATWGRMLFEGQSGLTVRPRLVVAPGLLILFSVLAFNLLGDGLSDAVGSREAS